MAVQRRQLSVYDSPQWSRCAIVLLIGLMVALDAAAQVEDRPQSPVPSAALLNARNLLQAGDVVAARAAFTALAQADDADAQDALAAMWLEGIGGPQQRETAMVWYCRLAHQASGGRVVMRAVWFLAEYFRTGGGLPGRRYNDGTPALQNPLRAYFWYQVMVQQADLYQTSSDDALKLGRLGSASVARELSAEERQQVVRDVQRWSSREPARGAKACLKLFDAGE